MTPGLEGRLRAGRRAPLFDPDALPRVDAAGPEAMGRLLPHRGSMLLVDAVVGLDAAAGRIVGRRRMAPDDPVFEGHFPDDPVYPGALQVEAVGQCGLCLETVGTGPVPPPGDHRPPGVRLARILAADFLAPVRPGDEALLLAERVDDGLTAVILGQMLVRGAPACVCAFEAVILDDGGSRG